MISSRCAITNEPFSIAPDELKYLSTYDIPAPSLGPHERLRRRFTFRHGGRLSRTTCAGTGRSIVSMYAPLPSSAPTLSVYESSYWWSDQWSGETFARDYDFNRSFFSQFAELFAAVPHISLINTNCENSYYTSHAINCRNCYLLIGAVGSDGAQYGYFIINCRDTFDGLSLHQCELCYDGVSSLRCYGCISFSNSRDCTDCLFIEDCQSCTNCIACVGLHGKSYYVLNQPVDKAKFEEIRRSLHLSRRGGSAAMEQSFEELKRTTPRLASHLYQCEDCSGDMLGESRRCFESFDSERCEQCRHVAFSSDSFDSYDCNFNGGGGVRHSYQCVSTLGTECHFSAIAWFCTNVAYSIECVHSHDLFGCVGLKRAEYCILNKRYPKEQYLALRAKIIQQMRSAGEWGEFFPASQALFAYNDSIADLYLPLQREAALRQGYRWNDDISLGTVTGNVVPEELSSVQDSILDQTLQCEVTGKLFKINAAELAFYRKMGLALPAICPEERHRRRLQRRHSFKLFPAQCTITGQRIDSIYPPEANVSVVSARSLISV